MHVVGRLLTMEMFSRTNTQALKGVAALGVFVFHIILAYNISPIFNMWGGFFVAMFLILSGYGLEESFRRHGLDGYWRKRMDKVILPTAFFIIVYNYLFPCFSSDGCFPAGESTHRCLDELLYITPTFWFVFFILKCYVVYWVGTRFLTGRLRLFFFVVCALVCLNVQAPCRHLEAEQSFCFLAGVLLSMNKRRVEALPERDVRRYMFLLFVIGAFFFCLKSVPQIHVLKGSIAYNYLLCPFRLSCGLAFIPLLTMLRVEKSALMRVAGKYSLEIYIAHVPFIGMITDARGTAVFFAYSVIGFLILMVYRTFVEKRMGAAEMLFVLVNMLFVAKYSARVSEQLAPVATLLSAVFYYALLMCCGRKWGERCKQAVLLLCILAFVGMVAVQYAIDPYSVRVDRWSALHFPIQNLLSGVYPYSASTHLGGNASPFPVWQIIHIPFYILGNVGLSFFAATSLFLWSCYKVQGREKALVICLLLCSSIAIWYEVAVRSDLITNFLLLAAIINLAFPRMTQDWVEKRMLWIACAVGLLASTRILVLIPVALLLMPFFVRMNWRKQVLATLLTLAVFALTFVPFAMWDWQGFYHYQNNPWALQTRQGNLADFILFVPLALFLSLNYKGNTERYYRNSAMMLALFVAITFLHNMYLSENWSLFSSSYDITYFTSALPFCLLALVNACQEEVSNV